jgi:hypothetical protein
MDDPPSPPHLHHPPPAVHPPPTSPWPIRPRAGDALDSVEVLDLTAPPIRAGRHGGGPLPGRRHDGAEVGDAARGEAARGSGWQVRDEDGRPAPAWGLRGLGGGDVPEVSADIQRLAGPNVALGALYAPATDVQRQAAVLGALAAPAADVQRQAAVLGALAAPAAEVQRQAAVLGHLAAPTADVQHQAAVLGHQAAPAADVHRVAAAPCALAAPTAAPCAMAVPSCALDAQDVEVDGASPTDASVVALARSLMPTVPHPAIEYNLLVLDVQRY